MDFNAAFDRLLGHEGGYVNDPRDPGGETNWGISKRSYPNINIKALSREGAKEIYKKDFWDKVGNAHPAVKFQVFDFAVNGGVSVAIQKLQLAVGAADDGHWGPHSQECYEKMELNDILMRFNAYRLLFYTDLKGWTTYSKGWARRTANNLLYAAQDN